MHTPAPVWQKLLGCLVEINNNDNGDLDYCTVTVHQQNASSASETGPAEYSQKSSELQGDSSH